MSLLPWAQVFGNGSSWPRPPPGTWAPEGPSASVLPASSPHHYRKDQRATMVSACLQNPDFESLSWGAGPCCQPPFCIPSGTILHQPGHAGPLASAQLAVLASATVAAEAEVPGAWGLATLTVPSGCPPPSPGSDSCFGTRPLSNFSLQTSSRPGPQSKVLPEG